MTDPTAEARKVLGGYWCNGNKRPCDDICAHCAEHANGVIAALDRAGKIVDKAPVGDCAELVAALKGAQPVPRRICWQAAETLAAVVRERDEARRALEQILRTPSMPFPDPGAHSWRAFGERVHTAWRQIQHIARAALSSPPESKND